MKEIYTELAKNNLFSHINVNDFEHLLTCLNAFKKTYQKNQIILIQGDPIRYIGLVIEGIVDIIKEDYMGNKKILNRLGPSDNFAEIFVCAGIVSSPVTVICETEATILFIDFAGIINTCENSCSFHNQLIKNMVKNISLKTLTLNENLEYLSKKTIKSRLSSYLINQLKNSHVSSFTIPFNRNELSEYLNVNRSALSRQLSFLKEEGILSFRKNTFHVLNHDALYAASLDD
ncbi:MAG: Crp/Fnr family transcriptional regulator [Clostridia bacterium]|nr:Crp/Fnr family transcriptional regulator [Clostridia bacterium]